MSESKNRNFNNGRANLTELNFKAKPNSKLNTIMHWNKTMKSVLKCGRQIAAENVQGSLGANFSCGIRPSCGWGRALSKQYSCDGGCVWAVSKFYSEFALQAQWQPHYLLKTVGWVSFLSWGFRQKPFGWDKHFIHKLTRGSRTGRVVTDASRDRGSQQVSQYCPQYSYRRDSFNTPPGTLELTCPVCVSW